MDSIKETGIKVVCISDTHNKANQLNLPKGDVLIHAGDFSLRGYPEEVEKFNDFLKQAPYEVKIVIAGNHDMTFDLKNYTSQLAPTFHSKVTQPIDPVATKAFLKDCVYLEDSSYDLQGYKVYGSPYTPNFHNWAFMLERGKDIQQVWDKIPNDTDILITHGPPHGILDEVFLNKEKVGCEELRKAVLERVKPMYHIFGHIHESAGLTKIDNTTFINAASVDIKYKPQKHQPFTFVLPYKDHKV